MPGACHETRSGILLLAAVEAGPEAASDPFECVTQMLYEADWASNDGTPATKWRARDAATNTYVPLIRLVALTPDRLRSAPMPTPTAPYTPAPPSAPGPHKATAAVAFNSYFPERTVAPLRPHPSAQSRG